VGALVVSGCALTPGQGQRRLGIEIAVTGTMTAVQAVWVSHGRKTPGGPRTWQIEPLATLTLPSVALVVGGVSQVAGHGGGLYWASSAILAAFVFASINAWVLLVEIKR
jgi:hypothetical protein